MTLALDVVTIGIRSRGFLDANKRPLRIHENVIIFCRRPRSSTYNPQMIKGKRHSRGNTGSPSRHYHAHRLNVGTHSDLYYPRSIIRFTNSRGGKSLHPTQKPLELMEWLVKTYTNPGDIILEPFAGSGSTLLAAQLHGRRAIGIELSEEYCETAANRLQTID